MESSNDVNMSVNSIEIRKKMMVLNNTDGITNTHKSIGEF